MKGDRTQKAVDNFHTDHYLGRVEDSLRIAIVASVHRQAKKSKVNPKNVWAYLWSAAFDEWDDTCNPIQCLIVKMGEDWQQVLYKDSELRYFDVM